MGDMGAGLGMLVVETIAKIRRAFFAQQKPIKAICREFRVSRKVVRKVIRSQATEFRYERRRQPLPRIDPWRDQLDELLLANEGKSARERLTLIQIFEELRGRRAVDKHDLVRPVKLVGFAWCEAQRHTGFRCCGTAFGPPPLRVAPNRVVAARSRTVAVRVDA